MSRSIGRLEQKSANCDACDVAAEGGLYKREHGVTRALDFVRRLFIT